MSRSRRLGRRTKEKKRINLFLFAFLGAAGLFVYLLLFAPILRIHAITVEAQNEVLGQKVHDVVQNEIEGRRFLRLIAADRYVLFDVVRIESIVAAQFPTIASVVVDIRMSGAVSVVVEERRPYGIVCRVELSILESDDINEEEPVDDEDALEEPTAFVDPQPFNDLVDASVEQCIYIDEKGVLYEEAPISRGSLIVSIVIANDAKMELGQKPLSDEVTQWLLAVIETLRQQESIEVTRFYVPSVPASTIYVETAEGWWIAMDAMGDHVQQLRSVVAILEEVITLEQRASLTYVDVRVPGRAFYK